MFTLMSESQERNFFATWIPFSFPKKIVVALWTVLSSTDLIYCNYFLFRTRKMATVVRLGFVLGNLWWRNPIQDTSMQHDNVGRFDVHVWGYQFHVRAMSWLRVYTTWDERFGHSLPFFVFDSSFSASEMLERTISFQLKQRVKVGSSEAWRTIRRWRSCLPWVTSFGFVVMSTVWTEPESHKYVSFNPRKKKISRMSKVQVSVVLLLVSIKRFLWSTSTIQHLVLFFHLFILFCLKKIMTAWKGL